MRQEHEFGSETSAATQDAPCRLVRREREFGSETSTATQDAPCRLVRREQEFGSETSAATQDAPCRLVRQEREFGRERIRTKPAPVYSPHHPPTVWGSEIMEAGQAVRFREGQESWTIRTWA